VFLDRKTRKIQKVIVAGISRN